MKIDICNCARCGNNHKQIIFFKLNNHKKYTHWGLCPELGQPILMIIKEDIKPKRKEKL